MNTYGFRPTLEDALEEPRPFVSLKQVVTIRDLLLLGKNITDMQLFGTGINLTIDGDDHHMDKAGNCYSRTPRATYTRDSLIYAKKQRGL